MALPIPQPIDSRLAFLANINDTNSKAGQSNLNRFSQDMNALFKRIQERDIVQKQLAVQQQIANQEQQGRQIGQALEFLNSTENRKLASADLEARKAANDAQISLGREELEATKEYRIKDLNLKENAEANSFFLGNRNADTDAFRAQTQVTDVNNRYDLGKSEIGLGYDRLLADEYNNRVRNGFINRELDQKDRQIDQQAPLTESETAVNYANANRVDNGANELSNKAFEEFTVNPDSVSENNSLALAAAASPNASPAQKDNLNAQVRSSVIKSANAPLPGKDLITNAQLAVKNFNEYKAAGGDDKAAYEQVFEPINAKLIAEHFGSVAIPTFKGKAKLEKFINDLKVYNDTKQKLGLPRVVPTFQFGAGTYSADTKYRLVDLTNEGKGTKTVEAALDELRAKLNE